MMNKYFIAINYTKDGNVKFDNLYYEINYDLNSAENLEKLIRDIQKQIDCKNVTIVFFKKLNENNND